jgi:lauroyl/myristoyl acyltransferase
VEGEEGYRDALASGSPVALVGINLGVFDLLHRLPTPPPGRPFRILTAPAFSAPLTRYMRLGRENGDKTVLYNRGMSWELRGLVKDKGVLAAMADQHPGRPEAYLRLWDRIEVPYPARLIRFLQDRRFRIVPVSTRLEPDGQSVYRFHPPWPMGGSATVGQPGCGSEAVREFMESAISLAPAQWNWSYPKIRLATAR